MKLLYKSWKGNVVSILLFLAPVPTFRKIYEAKSTMGFDPLPYATALMSSMLWLYYAMLTPDAVLIITINLFGSILETAYLIVFNIYANKKARAQAAKILGAMMGLLFLIFAVTFFVFEGHTRAKVVGWVCVALSICVFASPLIIIAKVVKTRSVEYMPFLLSFFLTLNAVMWFGYGLCKKDYYVALPNVGGFCLSMIQMLVYLIYRNKTPLKKDIEKNINVVNIKVVGTPDVQGTAAPAQITVQAPLNAVV
ncbi:bidirectional sugar transporter N3-like isoform X2 [Salvia hispanica]|uniref:bidirectional sugar transporter N3-like isoform X2 n=1 Tax=Salvia hispanica TaxID=49212 RepID=UPI002009D3B3|nr:bidirectional sugar transporter N3-like isoform X2 [Salvia hispanica]